MADRTVRDIINEMDLDTMLALTNILDNAKYSTGLKTSTIEFLTKRFDALPEEQRNVFWFIIGSEVSTDKEEL